MLLLQISRLISHLEQPVHCCNDFNHAAVNLHAVTSSLVGLPPHYTDCKLCCFLGDVYIQPTQDTKNPVIYGVFSVSG